MRHSPATFGGTALIVLLALGTDARAELIHWKYRWSNTPDKIMADKPGTSYFTVSSDADYQDGPGNATVITATSLRGYRNADSAKPDHFTDQAYTMTLSVHDLDTKKDGTLIFTGRL